MANLPPLFSMNASGAVGPFRRYVQSPKHWTIGKRPKEPDHALADYQHMGEAMDAANTLWRTLTAEQKQAWTERARHLALPLRQAFLAVNLRRLARHETATLTP